MGYKFKLAHMFYFVKQGAPFSSSGFLPFYALIDFLKKEEPALSGLFLSVALLVSVLRRAENQLLPALAVDGQGTGLELHAL
jgi:hypothetical protein